MKICVNCEYYGVGVVEVQPGHGQAMPICKFEECRDPVDGSPMPAHVCRKEQVFCGIQGKYYKLKEEKKPATLVQL